MAKLRGIAWMAVLGAACLLADAGWALRIESFQRAAVRVKGTVVAMTDIPDTENGGSNYAPKFEFRTGDGTLITVQSQTGTNPPTFFVGESVEVLYPAGDPAKARINSTLQLWLGAMIVGGVSLVFLLIGLVGPVLERKYGARQSNSEIDVRPH